MKVSSDSCSLTKEQWVPVKARYTDSDRDVEIEGVEELDVFLEHLVVYQRSEGKQIISVLQQRQMSVEVSMTDAFDSHVVDFSQALSKDMPLKIQPGANHRYVTDSFRMNVSSMLLPETPFEYKIGTKTLSPVGSPKQDMCSSYVCRELFVESKSKDLDQNGHPVMIPATIAYRNDFTPGIDDPRPLLLTAYGAYGHNNEADFDPGLCALLKEGWIIVHAHVRGGGEKGRWWYEQGRGQKKWNSFNDFIDITEYLLANGYSKPEFTCATAVSAGGLTLAVAAIKRPELFGGMILKVPFLDVLDTMMDSSLPLTHAEFDEWGNPQDDPDVYEYIQTYDPCKNVSKMLNPKGLESTPSGTMPGLLVTCSLSDMRVGFWGPAKFVAKIREQEGKDQVKVSNVLLDWTHDEGHFGTGGRFGRLEESAFEHAFLYKITGIE